MENLVSLNTAKQKILIFSDPPFSTSGVSGECQHICVDLLKNNYEVVVLATVNSPRERPLPKIETVTTPYGPVKIIPAHDFNDMDSFMKAMAMEQPKCLLLFQDPHFFDAVFQSAQMIRQKCPIVFFHVWDTELSPHPDGRYHWNLPIYESCDGIGTISKQTQWFVTNALTKSKYGKQPIVQYCGHGRDPEVFKPIPDSDVKPVKDQLFGNKDYNFVALVNNRNQWRKKLPDTIMAWRLFNESLPKVESDKTLLLLHTEPATVAGTDLDHVIRALAPNCNIRISHQKCNEDTINRMYNCADVVVNVANSEGFGLTTHEASLAGIPLIANCVGGLRDQLGYDDEWTEANFNESKHKRHGEWVYPLFGQRTIIGCPQTPYLYEYAASIDDTANAFKYWYNVSPEERKRRGLKGRQWCLDQGLTADGFSSRLTSLVKDVIAGFKPTPMFDVYPA